MTAKRLLAVLLSLGLALPAIADVHVITRTNTSGQTVTSAVTPGVTTVTGCTNEVLYGDASDLVGCEGALAYDAGDGVERDPAEAVVWFRKAAELAFTPSQVNLGVIYATGRGAPQDFVEAATWFRKAAEHGVAVVAQERAGGRDLGRMPVQIFEMGRAMGRAQSALARLVEAIEHVVHGRAPSLDPPRACPPARPRS